MKISHPLAITVALISFSLPACSTHEEQSEGGHEKIVVTSPKVMDVVLTQQYVCQIHAKRHIKIKAFQTGYLMPIKVNEGAPVNEGDVLFEGNPILYAAKLAAEEAEA